MTAPREWETPTSNTTRQAAMRRHPSRFSLDEVNPVWTDCDQLAAWTAHLDDDPTDHPIPDAVAFLLLGFLALIVPTLIVVAAWHWVVQ